MKNRKCYFLLTTIHILLLVQTFKAQCFWAKGIGGASNEESSSIVVDAVGNVYSTGNFKGTVDFDPGPGQFNLSSTGGGAAIDIYVCKLDAAGNFLWAKSMGGSSDDYGFSIALDPSGSVLITGTFSSPSGDYDPGPGTFNMNAVSQFDVFIIKLDFSGNFLWAKQFGGGYGMSIATDASGNVYTTGPFNGTVDFDPGSGIFNLTSSGSYDIFISKLDANGNFVWAKKLGGVGDDRSGKLVIDAAGSVYVTGNFSSVADFDPGSGVFNLTSLTLFDNYVVKLDAAGNFVWVKQLGGHSTLPNGLDFGNAIAINASGFIYVSGYYSGTADFDPSPGTYNLTAVGGNDVFVCKLDLNGNFQWARSMGGNSSDVCNQAVADASGSFYGIGNFTGTIDLDPGPSVFNLVSATSNNPDIFILKLDANGNFLWGKRIGGNGADYGNSVAVDATGGVYTTGKFVFTVDFDPTSFVYNLTHVSGYDIFIQKMPALSISSTVTNNVSCYGGNNGTAQVTILDGQSPYAIQWSNGQNTPIIGGLISGSYSVTVTDAQGCSASENITVSQPLTPMAVLTTSTPTNCSLVVGVVNSNPSGGTPPYSYFWNNGQTTQNISGLAAGNYSVTVTDANGCVATQSASVNYLPPIVPEICVVTVDSFSNFNLIFWDKTNYNGSDTFIVYRDISNNNYQRIGSVPFDSLSQFKDTLLSLFAANGDPNVSSWRYKLSVKDSCGNESALSPYHQTIFIQNIGANFIWNQYQIQGQTVPVPALLNYVIYRDDLSNGNWQPIQTLSASSTAFTDPNYAVFQNIASWRVETQWSIACNPSLRLNEHENLYTLITTSRSNVKNSLNTLGVHENSAPIGFAIYPNPAANSVTVTLNIIEKQNITIRFVDVRGREVKNEKRLLTPGNNQEIISVEELSSGIYFVECNVNGQMLREKLVKE